MPEETSTSAWAVTVARVVAVASQADVHVKHDEDGDTSGSGNDVFESPNIAQRITATQVEGWIASVAAWVSTTLHRRRRLAPEALAEFETAMGTAVEVGAAAYLVDAAYPQRAGVNDQASYGSVLWARYRQALEDLDQALTSRLEDPSEDTTGTRARAGAQFPAPIFTDGWVRESSAHLPAATGPHRAPGTETARW